MQNQTHVFVYFTLSMKYNLSGTPLLNAAKAFTCNGLVLADGKTFMNHVVLTVHGTVDTQQLRERLQKSDPWIDHIAI